MKKELFVGLLLIIFVGLAVYLILNKENKFTIKDKRETVKKEETKKAIDQIPVKVFTQSEVSAHNNPSDCWMIINNKVYNVTDFINKHPGGRVIANYCGGEATEAFKTKGGKGESHHSSALTVLESLYIGSLGKAETAQ